MNRSNLSLAAQLLIAGTNSLARTDFIETSSSVDLLNAHDGNPEPGAGTANEVDDSAREAKGTIVGDNTGAGGQQQEQVTTAGNAQQEQSSGNIGQVGGQQQEQSNDGTPQADNQSTNTAEVKTGGQDDTGGERQPE